DLRHVVAGAEAQLLQRSLERLGPRPSKPGADDLHAPWTVSPASPLEQGPALPGSRAAAHARRRAFVGTLRAGCRGHGAGHVPDLCPRNSSIAVRCRVVRGNIRPDKGGTRLA